VEDGGPATFAGACSKHFTERATGRCDDCGEFFCAICLVPPIKKRQPLRCVDCALVAAGVRAPGPRHRALNMNRTNRRPTSRF
jgi:hypothetical protein